MLETSFEFFFCFLYTLFNLYKTIDLARDGYSSAWVLKYKFIKNRNSTKIFHGIEVILNIKINRIIEIINIKLLSENCSFRTFSGRATNNFEQQQQSNIHTFIFIKYLYLSERKVGGYIVTKEQNIVLHNI